jgi:hypothetical protein
LGVAAALGGFVYTNIFRVEVVAFLLFVDTHPLFILKTVSIQEREKLVLLDASDNHFALLHGP